MAVLTFWQRPVRACISIIFVINNSQGMEKQTLFFDSALLNRVSKSESRRVKIRVAIICTLVMVSCASLAFATVLPRLNLAIPPKNASIESAQAVQDMAPSLKEEATKIVDSLIAFKPAPILAPIVITVPEPKPATPPKSEQKIASAKPQQPTSSSKPTAQKTSTTSKTATAAKPRIGGDSAPAKPQKDLHNIDENLPVEKRPPIPPNSNYGIPEYWPLPFKVTDPYGYLPWRGRFHSGIDITADCGELIFASGSGRVIRQEWFAGYGMCIDIEHASGYITRYGHLSEYLVKLGDMVDEGTWIGKVGTTGNSSCCHLHFEVHLNGHTVNPESLRWLNKVQ